MANQWLRLWHDMPTDPKWRTVAKVSGQRIGDVMAVYLHLLVCASNATERGRTQSFNCEDVASALDIETEHVASIIDAMQGRVLDGDMVAGWEKRQAAREDGSAERAKAWRDAKKAELNAAKTKSNATERNRTPDKDKSREEKETIAPTAVAFDAATGQFEIPDLLSTQWLGAYPALSLDVELSKASAWLIANPKNKKSNYARFLTNWLSKAQDSAPRAESRQSSFEGGI
jgi:hypothetical protein